MSEDLPELIASIPLAPQMQNVAELNALKPFVDARGLSGLMSVSKSFFRDLRDSGEWKEGVHWVYLSPGNPTSGIRYNTQLCLHWLKTRHNPTLHNRAIERYLRSLEEGH